MKLYLCLLIANLEMTLLPYIVFLAYKSDASKETIDKADIANEVNSLPPQWIVYTLGILFLVLLVTSAISVGIFTWKNYKLVISRSMLWRKSDVELLSSKIKYTASRIGVVIFIFFFIITTLA